MATTYEKIASTTLGSANATISFSSIPSTYTDLRLVFTGTVTSASSLRLTFNSDSGTNYSFTIIRGNGTEAASRQTTNASFMTFHNQNLSTTIPQFYSFDIFSYAGSTNKTLLATTQQDLNGDGSVIYTVGLWRNTSAINTITFTNSVSTFATGTTATLYGILKA
jgi:hypothetical protein